MDNLSFDIPTLPSRLKGDHQSKALDYQRAYAVAQYCWAVKPNEWVYTFCLSICSQMIENERGLSPRQKEVLKKSEDDILYGKKR